MTTQRLIQNFRKSQGLLWAGADFNPETLERALARIGVALTRPDRIDAAALDPERHIVFLDADQQIDAVALRHPETGLTAAPVIGLVGVEAPSRLRLLAESGATAILRKPISGAMVYSALFLGVNNFRRLASAESRVAAVNRKRRGRRYLIKAIVTLIQVRTLSDDEAYAELRREAMRRRLDLEEFCESLFAPGSPFPGAWPEGLSQNVPSREQGGTNAQEDMVGGRAGGLDGAADGPGRRSDQARRA